MSFMPHGHCYLWEPGILWLHVLSDAGTALAYATIPLAISRFVRLRTDLEFRWMFWLFGAFILACGTSHAMSVWTVWQPLYLLEGGVKAVTAGVSMATAVLLVPLVPRALRVPSPAQLRAAKEALEVEVAQRRRAEDAARELAAALESRVEERTLELRRANEDLQQFVQVVSHDLREPVRAVSNFTLLLEKRYGDALDDRARLYVRHASSGAERAQQMLADLVRYARLGVAPPDPEPVALADVVSDVVDDLREPIGASAAEIDVGPLPTVRTSRTSVRQLVQNLVSNALKYHGDAPPRVRLEGEGGPDRWTLRVVDHGEGVPAAQRERIFEMFSRLHTQDEVEGSGVGLAICRRIAERLGGTLRVEGTPGGGATFVLEVAGTSGHETGDPDA